LLRRFASNDALPEGLKAAALALVPGLRLELSADWPSQIYATNHPFSRVFGDLSPHWTAAFVEDGRDILAVKSLRKWPSLRARFKRPGDGSARALAELRIAARAIRFGGSVELDPATDGGRHADIHVETTHAAITVEVCIAQPLPSIAKDTSDLVEVFVPRFKLLEADIAIGGKILVVPPNDELSAIIGEFTAALEEVTRTKAPTRVSIPGVADVWMVGFSHPAYERMLDDGRVGTLTGPIFQWSPLRKLQEVIRDKAKQLPMLGAGVLVITPPSFLGQAPVSADLGQSLQTLLRELPHVRAIGLIGRLFSTEPDQEHALDPLTKLWQTTVFGPSAERVLFVRSPSATDEHEVALCEALLRRATSSPQNATGGSVQ
jgi:hypothetical protein